MLGVSQFYDLWFVLSLFLIWKYNWKFVKLILLALVNVTESDNKV